MPTYQYRCTECGEQLEVVQKFSEEPLTECPRCHGHLRKLFSSVGVVFKGSGFYKTDSRSTSRTSSSSSASSGSSGTDSTASQGSTGSTSTAASTSSDGKVA